MVCLRSLSPYLWETPFHLVDRQAGCWSTSHPTHDVCVVHGTIATAHRIGMWLILFPNFTSEADVAVRDGASSALYKLRACNLLFGLHQPLPALPHSGPGRRFYSEGNSLPRPASFMLWDFSLFG